MQQQKVYLKNIFKLINIHVLDGSMQNKKRNLDEHLEKKTDRAFLLCH